MNKATRKTSRPSPGSNTNSRDAILAAALKAFARDGFDGASMPKIAKMAEVAPPLIHYYFGSKDNLWRETVNHSLGELSKEALAISNATRFLGPLDRLRALLQAFTLFAARCPDQFVMIIAEARSESDRIAWLRENYTTIFFEGVHSCLQDAKDQSLIKDIDIEQLTYMMIGGILIYFTINPSIFGRQDFEQLADDYTDVMFTTFLDGIAVKKGDA